MIKKLFALLLVTVLAMGMVSCDMLRPAEEETVKPADETSDTVASAPEEAQSSSVPETSSPLPLIPTPEPGAPKTVCIDAGHGYDDPGCTTEYLNGAYERDIVAGYADSLKAELEAMGYRVIMLHTPEKYITAAEIAEGADKVGLEYKKDKLVDDGRFAAYNRTVWLNVLHRYTYIDAFISIHIDTFTADESVRGTRVYYCSETAYSDSSSKLCSAVTSALVGALPDTKARSFAKNQNEAYIVTKYSQMPSVLVEMGFATNPDDAENILDEEWKADFVGAMADGIAAFVGK